MDVAETLADSAATLAIMMRTALMILALATVAGADSASCKAPAPAPPAPPPGAGTHDPEYYAHHLAIAPGVTLHATLHPILGTHLHHFLLSPFGLQQKLCFPACACTV